MSTFTALIQHSVGIASQWNKARKEKQKANKLGKIKWSLFAGDIIVYVENFKESTKKLLELIKEFSKFTGYQINMEKSIIVLYISNEQQQN